MSLLYDLKVQLSTALAAQSELKKMRAGLTEMTAERDQLRTKLAAFETCETCEGDGLMDVEEEHVDGRAFYTPVTCAECDGSGIGHFASVVRERDELRAQLADARARIARAIECASQGRLLGSNGAEVVCDMLDALEGGES